MMNQVNATAAEPLSILYVEDDRLARVMLAESLRDAGYVVDEAESASDAMAYLGQKTVDLVLLDLNLPDRSGLTVAAYLAESQPTPLVVLTAYNDEALVRQALDLGAQAYLVKPVSAPQLLPLLQGVLQQFASQRSLHAENQRLARALEEGKVVATAVGILMERFRLSREAAFEQLRMQARNERRKIAELAEEVVAACGRLSLLGIAPR